MPANAPDADAFPAPPDARTSARTLAFRAAHAGDLPAVVALVESAYRGDASRAGWTTEADLLDGQRTSVADLAPLLERGRSRVQIGRAHV